MPVLHESEGIAVIAGGTRTLYKSAKADGKVQTGEDAHPPLSQKFCQGVVSKEFPVRLSFDEKNKVWKRVPLPILKLVF
jgi:hypothetical protein